MAEHMNTLSMTDRILFGISSQQQRIAAYLARQEIERIHAKYREYPKRLEPFGFKVYSQGDEDGVIEEICKRLDIKMGVFCEIGVENGLECNTLYLIHKGWRGLWLEGNPKQKEPIKTKFASLLNTRRLMLGIGFITPRNINSTLIQCNLKNIDFLSIDIDGNDIYLLEALQTKPKVICIEYNAKFPGHLVKKPLYSSEGWKGTDYMGSSLAALNIVAKEKGYTLVATNITGANAFFVRDDLISDKFCDDSSPENLYNPPRYWLVSDHFYHIGHKADFGPYVDLE